MERDQASKFVNDLLRLMVSRNGSDLFLTADFPPAIKVDGKVTKVSPQPLTGQHTLALTRAVANPRHFVRDPQHYLSWDIVAERTLNIYRQIAPPKGAVIASRADVLSRSAT